MPAAPFQLAYSRVSYKYVPDIRTLPHPATPRKRAQPSKYPAHQELPQGSLFLPKNKLNPPDFNPAERRRQPGSTTSPPDCCHSPTLPVVHSNASANASPPPASFSSEFVSYVLRALVCNLLYWASTTSSFPNWMCFVSTYNFPVSSEAGEDGTVGKGEVQSVITHINKVNMARG